MTHQETIPGLVILGLQPKKTIGNATGTVQPNGVIKIADGEYKDNGNVNIVL